MCMMDGDTAQVWSETLHRSAKERDCDCCGLPIEKGEPYIKHRSLYEGSWTSEGMCLVCHAMRREFARAPEHNLMTPSSFWEYLSSCVDHGDKNDPWIPLYNRFRVHCGKPELQLKWDDEDDEHYGRWV